jgi:NAD(P)-dependent dehydrogenase (short-subunit alcohol dehydrogenase family)
VILSGDSRGIGKATETALRASGCLVVGLSRHSGADVRDDEDVARVVGRTLRRHGRIDVVINNAGVDHRRVLMECVKKSEWANTISTNLMGPVYLIRDVLPAMKARRSGLVINMASRAGLYNPTGYAAYSASKAALISLTKTVAAETRAYDIKCVAVCPGPTDTPMLSHRKGVDYASHQQHRNVVAELLREMVMNGSAHSNIVLTGDVVQIHEGRVAIQRDAAVGMPIQEIA